MGSHSEATPAEHPRPKYPALQVYKIMELGRKTRPSVSLPFHRWNKHLHLEGRCEACGSVFKKPKGTKPPHCLQNPEGAQTPGDTAATHQASGIPRPAAAGSSLRLTPPQMPLSSPKPPPKSNTQKSTLPGFHESVSAWLAHPTPLFLF